MPTRIDRYPHSEVGQRLPSPRVVERFCRPSLLDRGDGGLNTVAPGRLVLHLLDKPLPGHLLHSSPRLGLPQLGKNRLEHVIALVQRGPEACQYGLLFAKLLDAQVDGGYLPGLVSS